MDCVKEYEKIYFNDNYKEQFEALRHKYHARTQEALHGRKIDRAPVPNATTVVYLNDNGDGDSYVTTGDFVEYFNSHFGGSDRLGAMRRSLSGAVHKAQMKKDSKKSRRKARFSLLFTISLNFFLVKKRKNEKIAYLYNE